MKKYFQAPWTTKDLIQSILISTLLLGLLIFINLKFLLGETIKDSSYKLLYLSLIFLLQWLIIFTPIFLISKNRHKIKKGILGFKRIGFIKTTGWVVGAFLLYIGISTIITFLILYTGIQIPGYNLQEKILPEFGDSLEAIILAGVIIIIIAPLFEEIFFRSIILRTLVNRIGIWGGSIIAATLFALFHFQFQTFIPIFILGLIINGLVIKSRSVIPALAFHCFNNILAFTVEVLIVKDVIKFESLL